MFDFTNFFMLFKLFLRFSVKFENHLKQNPNHAAGQCRICPKPESKQIQKDAECDQCQEDSLIQSKSKMIQ